MIMEMTPREELAALEGWACNEIVPLKERLATAMQVISGLRELLPDADAQEILDTPMERNDSGASTVRGYIIALAAEVWRHGEGFSGKRPFGNSGWHFDVYAALIKAGHVAGTFDEDGFIDELSEEERDKADLLISNAIASLT